MQDSVVTVTIQVSLISCLTSQRYQGFSVVSTIRKVAKDAGVSIATVSRVINNHNSVAETIRERVLDSINRCGYVPSVGKRTTNLIGLVYASQFSLGSPYDSALLQGMANAMEFSDLDLVILHLGRDIQPNESYTQFFLRKGVRGVILRNTVKDRDLCKAIAREKFPCIVVGDHFDDSQVNFVYGDSKPSSYQGVEHLIALGHRQIAFASSDTDDGDHLDRYAAYEQAMQDHGIPLDPRLHYRIPAHRSDGAQLLRNMMSSMAPPTAVFITDPLVAIGAINESQRLGIRVPEDISILGFDDADARNNVYPRMTAVCQDATHCGTEVFTLLAELIGNGQESDRVLHVASTWLEVNETTSEPVAAPFRILPGGARVLLEKQA